MLLRIWKVSLVPHKLQALEDFARSISLPMFEKQAGCLAVFFTRTDTECATVTLWASPQAVQAMEASPDYQQVVAQIESSGILGGDHRTEVFSVYGGFAAHGLSEQVSAARV